MILHLKKFDKSEIYECESECITDEFKLRNLPHVIFFRVNKRT